MATEYPTSIRLPDHIRRDLRRLAKSNRRSLTRQIVQIVSDYLEKNPVPESARKKAPVES